MSFIPDTKYCSLSELVPTPVTRMEVQEAIAKLQRQVEGLKMENAALRKKLARVTPIKQRVGVTRVTLDSLIAQENSKK